MSLLRKLIFAVCITAFAGSAAIAGISGTFVKADATNTSPGSAIAAKDYADGYDAQWSPLPWGSYTALSSYAKFDPVNGIGEDCPQLTTSVNTLDPTKTYEIYVQFFAVIGGSWGVYANLSGQAKQLYTLHNSVKTGIMYNGTDPICEVKLGTVTGVSSFSVDVDDYSDSSNYAISAYYGVSYKEVPTKPAGISGTFVKATTSNTGPSNAIAVKTYEDGYDGLWTPWNRGNLTDVLTSYAKFDPANGVGEDCSQITTTVNTLDPTKTYEVYVVFCAAKGGYWGIYANMPGQPKKLVTVSNATETGLTFDGTNPICEYKVGVVSGTNTVSVNVDDYNDSTNYALSVYYGVSYKEVPAGTNYGGITGVFVHADTTNTTPADALTGTDWNGYDQKWDLTNWGKDTAYRSFAKFDPASGTGEDCPQLTTTVNGLDSSKTYDIYAQFYSGYGGNWSLYANLAGKPSEYLYLGNSTDTMLTFDGTNPICEYKLGTVSGVNSFAVNVDDFSNSSDYALSVYYGVSYNDVTPGEPTPTAPVVGINNKAVNDSIIAPASANYQFKVWGRVSILSTNSFTVDDGSGVPVTVIAPSYTGIANGNYVSVVGTLTDQSGTRVLNAKASDVVKLSD
ncbi:MAG: hypothetical protein ABFD54_14600 [Armatimonadota bacterium]|nr:hypothetical protein [bacterium]